MVKRIHEALAACTNMNVRDIFYACKFDLKFYCCTLFLNCIAKIRSLKFVQKIVRLFPTKLLPILILTYKTMYNKIMIVF